MKSSTISSLTTADTPRNVTMGIPGGVSFDDLSKLRVRRERLEERNEKIFDNFLSIYGEKVVNCICGKVSKLKEAHECGWRFKGGRYFIPGQIRGMFFCDECQNYKDSY